MNYKYFKSKEEYLEWYIDKKYYIKAYSEIGNGILIKYIEYNKEKNNDVR